jgi:tetratricopeptide (TPR) repeat protein
MSQNIELQIYTASETYMGARATPELVGREGILAQIQATIQDKSRSYLIYITGRGGTGKTRLIQQLLKNAAEDGSLMVADELIDLYHTRVRSVGGLIGALLEVVKPLGRFMGSRPWDTEVDKKLEALARAEQEGLSPAELISRRQELTDLFLEIVNRFTIRQRLVLALDTTEQLFVARDVAQERLGLSEQRPAILDWLLDDFLPKVENAVILLAGRLKPLALAPELNVAAERAKKRFLHIDLQGLTEEETLAYFEVLADSASRSGNPADAQAARTIRLWSDHERRTIFYCLHDAEEPPRIRPILLALAIDHLVVSGRPLAALTRPLAEAKALSAAQRHEMRVELGKALVQTLHEYRRPADDIIINLGWLRKGADVALLAQLTGLKRAEVEQALSYISDLSFVKTRPADNRIFLHDEMYTILQRYGLEHVADAERERVFRELRGYYEQLIRQARIEIDELYRPQADTFEETLPDPGQVRMTRARLQDAIVEDLYYRLRWNAEQAFQKYFLYIKEAIASNDETLGAQLRTEFFSFLAERDPAGQAEEIDGLRWADVIADSAVRWIEWLWNEDKFDEALQTANRLASEARELIEPGGPLAEAHLNAWRGYLFTYAGDYRQAGPLLNETINKLLEWSQVNKPSPRWAGILGRAYNSSGYLYDRQTRPYRAIETYAKAVPLWQTIQLPVEEAATLNNRAFALAKIGLFHTAIPQAKDALRLREQLGPRVPVGLSINTLALIELAQNDLAGALRDARRALQIFTRLNSPRGLGLALIALAEAERRNSESATYLQQGRSAEFLEQAVGHALEAVHIFTETVTEPGRLMEAWRELGRAYREWARLRQERPQIIAPKEQVEGKYTVEMLAQLSQVAFRKAEDLAGDDIHSFIEVLFDQALLEYYTKLYKDAPAFAQAQTDLNQGLLTEIENLIPEEYRTPPSKGIKLKRFWFLVHSGNVALLRGHIAFNQWQAQPQAETGLRAAVEHYTLALAYYAFFSDYVFQEMRQALDQIYDHLRQLTPAQKVLMYQIVAEVEAAYDLGVGESRMSQFLTDRFGTIDIFEFDL